MFVRNKELLVESMGISQGIKLSSWKILTSKDVRVEGASGDYMSPVPATFYCKLGVAYRYPQLADDMTSPVGSWTSYRIHITNYQASLSNTIINFNVISSPSYLFPSSYLLLPSSTKMKSKP